MSENWLIQLIYRYAKQGSLDDGGLSIGGGIFQGFGPRTTHDLKDPKIRTTRNDRKKNHKQKRQNKHK
jgi:hypothetical protein